ncbi:magnesium transporter MRS2-B isoform X2 [Phoenix dactylifera]|uniref:Magnesium transporter n=1 Tax=Phoenix dactylifera TaxID=42345 RepID=A0A8B7MY95_PHODC|nr:magnesium transporter MRS2-B isoform X2 [Phoenix dactylifera]
MKGGQIHSLSFIMVAHHHCANETRIIAENVTTLVRKCAYSSTVVDSNHISIHTGIHYIIYAGCVESQLSGLAFIMEFRVAEGSRLLFFAFSFLSFLVCMCVCVQACTCRQVSGWAGCILARTRSACGASKCCSAAAELEMEAYPLLDELTSKISTLNLERVRRLKSRLVALTRRVQKVRDEIEQLMDDDGDMAEMYLTEKKKRMEASFYGDQSVLGYSSAGAGVSVSAPVSPVSSPPGSRKLEKTLSFSRSRHESMKSSDSMTEHIEELEMLLEAYFVVIDSTLNKLTSLKEYIDDTEDFINIQLDNVRNQLIQFELLLTTATFVVAIFGVVAGIFGMNFAIPLFDKPDAFQWVLIIAGVSGVIIFCSFLWFFRYRRLMPL